MSTTIKLRCDNRELLSAVAAMKDVPLMEECGSDTRSISHHVRMCSCMICTCTVVSRGKLPILDVQRIDVAFSIKCTYMCVSNLRISRVASMSAEIASCAKGTYVGHCPCGCVHACMHTCMLNLVSHKSGWVGEFIKEKK